MMKKILVLLVIINFVFVISGTVKVKAKKKENKDSSLIVKFNGDDLILWALPEKKSEKRKRREKLWNDFKTGEKRRNHSVSNQEEILQSAPDRILVKYKKQAEAWIQASVKASIEATSSIEEIKRFSFIDVYLYKTYQDKEKTLEELNKSPNIEYAEPDYLFYIDSTIPNDPSFDELWGLHNTGQTGGSADADIDAPEAWDLTTGSSNVIVAVIDSGVDYNHEDLNANMWTNSGEIPDNGIDDDDNGYVDDYYGINAITDSGDPMDDHGHGTHCSGTIAAVGDNGIGVVGVCWTAKIMALKCFNSEGKATTSDEIECIEYAINKDAHIMSNSWGGYGFSRALEDAVVSSYAAGILFIASAGNDGVSNDEYPHYPSSYNWDNVIAVTATDSSDDQYYNYGHYSVDVAAPGKSIYSTLPDNSYASLSGTSMATPHVSGLAALIKSYDSTLSWSDIKSRILSAADQKDSLQGKCLTGGRINAYNSLTAEDISFSLNIQSSPDTNAYIEVSPNDLNSEGDGYTNFTRLYSPWTWVTLTADATNNGRNFGYWTFKGTRYSEERSISIHMDYDHTVVAVYPLWTLTVESSPDTNVYIEVSPSDENGEGSGNTNFTREYQHGTGVTLTAPAEYDGKKFIRWLKDGTSFDVDLTTTINTDDDYSLTAYYSDKLNWRFNAGDGISTAPAIGSDGTIYFGCDDGKLYALYTDGTKKWEFTAGGAIDSSPAIGSDGTIYFGCDDYKFYALYPDGTKKWEFTAGDTIDSSPAISSDGTIYFGCDDSKLYALYLDGTEKWEFTAGDTIDSSPAIGSDGTIYFGCDDSKLYALNPDGTKKWEYESAMEGDRINAPPAIGSDGTIYVGGWAGVFYAVNPDGTLKWPCGFFKYLQGSAAIGTNDVIYMPKYAGIQALDSDGARKWNFYIGIDSVFSSPAIDSDGNIYFGANNHKFYAVDSEGNEMWQFITGGAIDSSPAIGSDGTVYFGSQDGYLYALESDSQGLADSSWPKFHRNNRNKGRVSSSTDLTPSVSITSPSDGDTVYGTVSIQASALDDDEVSKVEFYIDDELKSTDTISPYAYSWDTTLYAGDTRTIKVTAYDNASQTSYSEISVTVLPNPIVSGNVKTGEGAGLEGVTITFSNEGGTTTTDSEGNYSHTVSYGWSGTATPSLAGYTFDPATRTYTDVTSDQADQDHSATLLTYIISGNVSLASSSEEMKAAEGISGAKMIGLPRNLQEDKVREASSSGKIRIQSGLSEVVMSGLPGNPQTDASGNYSATVDYGWSGTVTPTLAGYTFSPPSKSYSDVTSDQTQDYTATAITPAISGAAETSDGKGVAGVEITFSNEGGTTTTDSEGNYSHTVSYSWSGTATPSLAGYTFDPATRTYTDVTSDQTDQDYTATLSTYTISGNVSLASSSEEMKTAEGLSGVKIIGLPRNRQPDKVIEASSSGKIRIQSGLSEVVMGGLPGNPQTDASGNYNATVDYGWSGTVTPQKEGYDFDPTHRDYSDVTSDLTEEDYTGTLRPSYTLSISAATGSPAPGEGGTTDPSPGGHSYFSGDSVQIRAVPNTDYRFSKWTGDVSDSETCNDEITILMEKDKLITANFCIKCGDVNGDLSITPGDAQQAFEIYLGKTSSPTDCQKENADVNCDGTGTELKVTPEDALDIFEKFLGKSDLPCNCSCDSRTGTVLMQRRPSAGINLIINDIKVSRGEEIVVPIIIDNPFNINAFGFDLIFPSQILEFVGIERTELLKDFHQVDANKIGKGILRIGGYSSEPIRSRYYGVLITVIFRVIGEPKETSPFIITNTVDDIENAAVKTGMLTKK